MTFDRRRAAACTDHRAEIRAGCPIVTAPNVGRYVRGGGEEAGMKTTVDGHSHVADDVGAHEQGGSSIAYRHPKSRSMMTRTITSKAFCRCTARNYRHSRRSTRRVTGPGRSKIETSPVT